MRRRLLFHIGGTLIAGTAAMIAFQNCGGGQFHSYITSNQSAQTQPAPNLLTLVTPANAVQPGTAFTVTVNQSGLPPATTTYLWETDFSNGLIFCDETTSFDASTTSISCPQNGVATVAMTVTTADGTTQDYTLAVNVGTVIAPTPTPGVSPSPTPSPSGTPMQEDTYTYLSQNLFNVCSGCHNSTVASAGYDFSSLMNMISTGGIVPGNAAASPAYQAVSQGQMPLGGPQFNVTNPALVSALATWINNGANNN